MYPKVSFLVLDFLKEEETRNCLNSIKNNAKFPHLTIYLDNGGFDKNYPNDLYKDNLCDILIRNKEGTGCGNGISQLFDVCPTEYAILFQNDQELIYELNENHINSLISLLENNKNIGYLDLAGGQAGQNTYSERAGLINVNFYKSIYTGEKNQKGGPGPFNHIRYTESFVQEYFKNNNLQVIHIQPQLVRDCGKWSIRKIGDGLYKWRTDTKQLYILEKPTYKTEIWPPFNENEWIKAINGEWLEGDIPIAWKDFSFKYWQ